MAITIIVILALIALGLSVVAMLGKWTPIATPIAVFLLAVCFLIQRIPVG